MDAKKWIKFFEDAGVEHNAAVSYGFTFFDNKIELHHLRHLSPDYLRQMNITLFGHIIAIIEHSKVVTGKISHSEALPPESVHPIYSSPLSTSGVNIKGGRSSQQIKSVFNRLGNRRQSAGDIYNQNSSFYGSNDVAQEKFNRKKPTIKSRLGMRKSFSGAKCNGLIALETNGNSSVGESSPRNRSVQERLGLSRSSLSVQHNFSNRLSPLPYHKDGDTNLKDKEQENQLGCVQKNLRFGAIKSKNISTSDPNNEEDENSKIPLLGRSITLQPSHLTCWSEKGIEERFMPINSNAVNLEEWQQNQNNAENCTTYGSSNSCKDVPTISYNGNSEVKLTSYPPLRHSPEFYMAWAKRLRSVRPYPSLRPSFTQRKS